MRVLLSLLVCTGCNQWFGLDGTQLSNPDAQFFDAPGPGVRMCPPIGTPPQFQDAFHPASMSCFGISATEDNARATVGCSVTDGPKIFAGPLDGPFTLVAALDVTAPMHRDWPRLAPEGELFVREWNTSTTTSEIHAYTGAYELDFVVTGLTLDSFAQFGTPSRGPIRHMFARPQPTQAIVELAIAESGAATIVHTNAPGSLGFVDIYSVPNLSPDGLRMVVQARVDAANPAAIYYLDRAALDVPWSAPSVVAPIAGSTEAYMTADCGRLYFLSGGTLVFAEAK